MSDELDRAMREAVGRLQQRGVSVSLHDDSDLVAQLLEAVEKFELTVERMGGDLMVDSGNPEQPDDPRFVLPKRSHGEALPDYRARIDQTTRKLKRASRDAGR